MHDANPTRSKSDLADMVEMLLDKGVVINADIAVSVGDTQLLGIEVRAAIASFETAAKYGLEFPAGTDEEMIEQAAGGRPSLESTGRDESTDGEGEAAPRGRSATPTPEVAPRVATDPATGGSAPGVEDRGEADDRAQAADREEAASDDGEADVETRSDGEADAQQQDPQEETDDHDDDD